VHVEPGTVVDRKYEVLGSIAEGGMGRCIEHAT